VLIAREQFFLEMAELRRSGRTLTPEKMTAFTPGTTR
jgi:hypothetical protein